MTRSQEGEIRFAKWLHRAEGHILELCSQGAFVSVGCELVGPPIVEQLEAAKLRLFNHNVALVMIEHQGTDGPTEVLLFSRIDSSFAALEEEHDSASCQHCKGP